MASNRTEGFASALRELEQNGDLDGFVSIFADGAELTRPEKRQAEGERQDTRAFWQEYLAVFDHVSSDFSRIVDGEVGVLEWVSTGQLGDGSDISYAGVSLVDFDESGKITRFATYYDTEAFRPHLAQSS